LTGSSINPLLGFFWNIIHIKFYFMPYKEQKVEKLYYSIGEVSKMFGVKTSLIRYWEREFDVDSLLGEGI